MIIANICPGVEFPVQVWNFLSRCGNSCPNWGQQAWVHHSIQAWVGFRGLQVWKQSWGRISKFFNAISYYSNIRSAVKSNFNLFRKLSVQKRKFLMSWYHIYFVGREVIIFLFFSQVYCAKLLVEITGKKDSNYKC